MYTTNESQEAFNSLFSELSPLDVKKLDLKHKISSKILSARKALGLGQKEFAEHLSVSQGLIARWESGNTNFTIDALVETFDKLHMSVDISISDPDNPTVHCKSSESIWSNPDGREDSSSFDNDDFALAG